MVAATAAVASAAAAAVAPPSGLEVAALDFDCFMFEGAEPPVTPAPSTSTRGGAKAKAKSGARAKAGGKAKAKAKDKAKAAAAERGSPCSAAGGGESCPLEVEDSEEEAAEGDGETPAKRPRRQQPKYRQAAERDAGSGRVQVEVLCTTCRKSKTSGRQASLAGFFSISSSGGSPTGKEDGGSGEVAAVAVAAAGGLAEIAPPAPSDAPGAAAETSPPPAGPAVFSHGAAKAGEGSSEMLFCSRCLMPMHDQRFRSIDPEHRAPSSRGGGCPLAAALKRYKQQAVQTSAHWGLTDSQALALMRRPCVLCGTEPDLMRGAPNGITRLRQNNGERSMGPYSVANTATACAACNMMKGYHTLEGIRDITRHIATHRGLGDFGLFPQRFVDNTSKRSRSCYLADHKTHALTNEQFNKIVEQPCHYCGKQYEKGKHYNGLDRLDNSVRVYTESTCVSCCGTCNMAKGRHSEALFLQKCREIAARAARLEAAEAGSGGGGCGGIEAGEAAAESPPAGEAGA